MPGFVSLSAISAAAALRVGSLDLCADEYLLSLALPREVASVSRLSHDPADSPLWRQARRYPANGGSVEGVLGTRPTLLLTVGGSGGRATGLIARRLGIRMLALPYPASLADVEANMVRVATALGDPTRAEAWRRRLAALEQRVPPPSDAIFVTSGGNGLGAGSLGAAWLRLAGYRQRALPGGRMTLEQLALDPPAVLLLSDYRSAQASLGERWLRHPLIRRAPSRRIVAEGRRWTCAGPLMLGEIERLRGLR